jgi:hypothetical protein
MDGAALGHAYVSAFVPKLIKDFTALINTFG